MSRTHILKTWPEPFQAVLDGRKRYEIRVNDRFFVVGEVLHLKEYRVDIAEAGALGEGAFTGREAFARVTYMSPGGTWGLPANLCVLSIELEQRIPAIDMRQSKAPIPRKLQPESSWWKEWKRLGEPNVEARSVPCPTCSATTGYCRRPSGHKAMTAHAARWDAALRALGGQL